MFYEEKVIAGKLMCRSTPGGEWELVTPAMLREIYPECSGFPQCCPENEGYGCCMGNQTKLYPVATTDGPEG